MPWDHEVRILRIESFQIHFDSSTLKSSREHLIYRKFRGLKSIIFVVARLPDPHKQIRLEESFKMTQKSSKMKGSRASLTQNEVFMPLFDTWMTFGDP